MDSDQHPILAARWSVGEQAQIFAEGENVPIAFASYFRVDARQAVARAVAAHVVALHNATIQQPEVE